MKRYTYTYQKATTRIFDGTYQQLVSEINRTGEYLKYTKNGKYYIGHQASGFIYEIDTDRFAQPKRFIDPRPYFRYVCLKKRVTETDYIKLTEKLNDGKILFDELYSEYGMC